MTISTLLRTITIVAPVAVFLLAAVRKNSKSEYQSFRGVVDRIDIGTKQLVMRNNDKQMVFKWDENCRVYDIDQRMTIAELRLGTSATVQFKKLKRSEPVVAKVEIENVLGESL